jgi:hypothetical protein
MLSKNSLAKNLVDLSGRTVLSHAAEIGNLEIAQRSIAEASRAAPIKTLLVERQCPMLLKMVISRWLNYSLTTTK